MTICLSPTTTSPAAAEHDSRDSPRPVVSGSIDGLPNDTLRALVVIGEPFLKEARDRVWNGRVFEGSEPAALASVIQETSIADQQLIHITDTELYERVKNLISESKQSIATIHSFSKQYFDPLTRVSRCLLLESIRELVPKVYELNCKLTPLLAEADRQRQIPLQLELPSLLKENSCKVLQKSSGTKRQTQGDAIPLTLDPLAITSQVAEITYHSNSINPHSHLLVTRHLAVSSDGELRAIDRPKPTASDGLNSESHISLRFEQGIDLENLPEIPTFSVKETNENTVTYTYDPAAERAQLGSCSEPEKAELCVPEAFTKLLEIFQDGDFTPEQRAQLVAGMLASQRLIYSRAPQISSLLKACEPKHRLSLILGLGMADCMHLSSVLQQLLAHAEVDARVEAGPKCSPDGTGYEAPGHGRVMVYGSHQILRLDPTLWCIKDTNIGLISLERLQDLLHELRGADAKTCYEVGRRARKLMENGQLTEHGAGGFADSPPHGHQLSDDFNPQSQLELFRRLASNEQDVLVAEVWQAYQDVLTSATSESKETSDGIIYQCKTIKTLWPLLGEEVVAKLEKEVELFGLANSKISEILPKMIQSLLGDYQCESGLIQLSYFIRQISSLELRSVVISRALSREDYKGFLFLLQLASPPAIAPTDESARFLVRILTLLTKDTDRASCGIHPYQAQSLALIAETFPSRLRGLISKAIFDAVIASGRDLLVDLSGLSLERHRLFSPKAFPKEMISLMFPEFRDDAIKFAERLFAAQDLHLNDFRSHLIALITISQYFGEDVRPKLEPLVRSYVLRYLKNYPEEQCADFSSDQAVSALCELAHIDAGKTFGLDPLVGSNKTFVRPALHSTTNLNSHGIDQFAIKLIEGSFNNGYLLRCLCDLGVLDVKEIKEALSTPKQLEILTEFHLLAHVKTLLWGEEANNKTLCCDPHSLIDQRRAELLLAFAAAWAKKDSTIPHATLLRSISEGGLVSQEMLKLGQVVVESQNLGLPASVLDKRISESIMFLFGIHDQNRLRSYARIRLVCSALNQRPDEKQLVPSCIRGVQQELSKLKNKYGKYAALLELYLQHDGAALIQETASSSAPAAPEPDQDVSLRGWREKIVNIHAFWSSYQRHLAPHRSIVGALIGPVDQEVFKDAPKLSSSQHSSFFWRNTVAKSLRSLPSTGAKQLLSKISLSQTANFDRLKPYTTGADPRTIDHKASAKRDILICRTYTQDSISSARAYEVVINLADLVDERENFDDTKCKYVKEIHVNHGLLNKVSLFVNSLCSEGQRVTISAFALGAQVFHEVITPGGPESRKALAAASKAMTELFAQAKGYAKFCLDTDCNPKAFSIAGLMSSEEQACYRQELQRESLLLHLIGNAGANDVVDPLMRELEIAGRAARVNVEL
jgi:hypothetical protein